MDAGDHIDHDITPTEPTQLREVHELAHFDTLIHSTPPVQAPRQWRTHALDLIHKLSHDVIDTSLVSPILHDIASIITSSFPITCAAIETYNIDDTVDFSAVSSTSPDVPSLFTSTAHLSMTLAGEVHLRGTTLLLTDTHTHTHYVCPSVPDPMQVYHYIGVPLMIDGKKTGVLSIATTHHIVFDKETVTWAETVAHHISALLTREHVVSTLKAHENMAAHMLNALSSPTMMCTKDGTIIHANTAFRSIIEIFHQRTIDENSTNFHRLLDNNNQSNSYIHDLRERLNDLFEGEGTHSRIDILLTRAGFHRWYLATMSLMPDRESAIVMFVDISDRKQIEEQLEHEMLHDQSTGLANRILFHERVNNSYTHNTSQGRATCVLAVEINRYAFIVESLGYDAADRVIGKVAKRLETILHPSDLIARVGSAEFAILVDRIDDVDHARNFSLNIIDLFRRPFEIDGQELPLVPSIGITVTDIDSQLDADMIMHDAHAAMTTSRDHGHGRYAFSSVSRSSEAYKKLTRERELHNAIMNNELMVYYQPEIELLTGRVIGAEALVRWNHPVHGILAPDQFIPLAEETGLVELVFENVFEQVVRDGHDLFARGFPITLWSNLSVKQFANNTALAVIAHHISQATCPSSMFGIEITETAVMENSESAFHSLTKMKEMGLSLALDDFGTGYSSLAYLQRFPVDIIKIDRTFISNLTSKESAEIVSAVIGLAHGLKLTVLAEGVETIDAVTQLRNFGCDLAQGYNFAHPMAFTRLCDFLARE